MGLERQGKADPRPKVITGPGQYGGKHRVRIEANPPVFSRPHRIGRKPGNRHSRDHPEALILFRHSTSPENNAGHKSGGSSDDSVARKAKKARGTLQSRSKTVIVPDWTGFPTFSLIRTNMA